MCEPISADRYKIDRELIKRNAGDKFYILKIWAQASKGLRRLLEPIIYACCPQAYYDIYPQQEKVDN